MDSLRILEIAKRHNVTARLSDEYGFPTDNSVETYYLDLFFDDISASFGPAIIYCRYNEDPLALIDNLVKEWLNSNPQKVLAAVVDDLWGEGKGLLPHEGDDIERLLANNHKTLWAIISDAWVEYVSSMD